MNPMNGGAEMKTCRKCNQAKPESEFYKRRNMLDGLDAWCKICRRKDTHSRVGKSKLAASTELALRFLSENGIPTTTGFVMGRPGKDLVAYGYISIEAKSAVRFRKCGAYSFGLTKAQRMRRCEFYILIFSDVSRIFVLPGDSELLNFKSSLYINITDPRMQQYENAVHLIKDKVICDIKENHPFQSVRVASGSRVSAIQMGVSSSF